MIKALAYHHQVREDFKALVDYVLKIRLSEVGHSKEENISSLEKVICDAIDVSEPRHIFSILLSDLATYRNIQMIEFLRDNKEIKNGNRDG